MAWVVKIAFCNKQFFILYMKCLIQLLMTLVVVGLVHDLMYCHAILQSWAFTLILWWSSDYFWFCCIFCTSDSVCMYIHAPHLMLWWLFDDKFSTSRCFFLCSVLLLNVCFIEVGYIIVESCKLLCLTFICVFSAAVVTLTLMLMLANITPMTANIQVHVHRWTVVSNS